ncbi:MAG TPA: two-component regulator propeller domain-containing protein [Pyrinomonadaceae bacterium]|jgi:ligand-binding sensor domain-containing protein
MRLPFKKIFYLALVLLVLSFVIFHIFRIYGSVRKTLADERARLIEQNRVPFEKKVLTPHLSQNIRILQNTGAVRDFVKFREFRFAATGGGLVQFDEDGKILRHFTVLDGLPESDLTALAVFGDRLFIGTQTKNLIAFDGEKFESYRWTDRQAQAVTAFLAANGKLLIGTFAGGLIEFDGKSFSEIKAEKTRLSAINCLYKTEAKLFVGTFNDGLWIYENDIWTHFTTAEGLPSNRVVGIAARDKNLYVATDFGLSVLQEKVFRTLAVLPSLSSLLALQNRQLFLAKDDGEIFTFDDSLKEFSAAQNLQNTRLISIDENLHLLSNQGVSLVKGGKILPFSQAENNSLTDNFVSALAFDRRENLWVGTFRRGIDVFSADGKKLKHIESETVREINFLQARGEEIFAAASSGLIRFKTDFSIENLAKKDGLPSNSVMHFSVDFIATAKGLTFRENGKFRVLSTVNGLPNNSVYTTLQRGGKLYAGTLGGLAEIENNRVARTFKDTNSNLKTNWVTALSAAGERIFIGTYGGGVFELLPSGEIRSFESETQKFVVNPNAIFSDGERLYIGTLEGVKILDLQTERWKTVRNVLPAETVLSIAGDAENVYFGTTGGIARINKNHFRGGESE